MARAIYLIRAGNGSSDDLEALLRRGGLDVKTPETLDDPEVYESAVCLVIDMPGDAPYRTLRLFRDYGIATPALLIVDPDAAVTISELNCGGIMDIVPRGANPLGIMRWIQSLCAARQVLDRQPLQVSA